MKALTIHQPYASLIALGLKEYETRSWKTAYRGLVAIHAGKSNQAIRNMPVYLNRWITARLNSHPKYFNSLPFGAIIAIAELVDCIPVIEIELSQEESVLGNYAPGRYAWKFRVSTRLYAPIAASGKQGLWDWNEEIRS